MVWLPDDEKTFSKLRKNDIFTPFDRMRIHDRDGRTDGRTNRQTHTA